MSTSVVVICPAANIEASSRFFYATGQVELDVNTPPLVNYISVKLSADGQEPATHYACRTDASDDLWSTLAALKVGEWGPLVPANVDWSDWGTTEAAVLAFGSAMSLNADENPPRNGAVFLNACAEALELQRVIEEL